MPPEDLSGDAVIGLRQSVVLATLNSGNMDCTRFPSENKDLPMIEQKKTSELVETSLIWLLGAGVAIAAFMLMWLLAVLTGLA